MTFLNETINVSDLPQSVGYDLLPDGWYTATINKAELTPTKDGSGQYIKMRYDITGPTHQGRVVFGNVNIRNQSVKAEEIGRQQLGDIMRAIGLAQVTDTDQLIGGVLQIKVATKPADGKYEASNEIKGYKSASGGSPAPVTAPVINNKPKSAGSAPWMK